MSINILPAALRQYRSDKGMTQAQLANATKGPDKVSEPTIKRIESNKELYRARSRVAQALAKALGVVVEALATAPSSERSREEQLQKDGYRRLRTMVDGQTALAFNMVRDMYGISVRSQVIMAPLFAALLAEGSLSWRRKRADAIIEAAERLKSLGGGHLSFAYSGQQALDGASDEQEAIEERDLFGKQVSEAAFDFGYDPSRTNPFVDYLSQLATDIDPRVIRIDKGPLWKTDEGLPLYRIGIEWLAAGDPDAEDAIQKGRVKYKDIPRELLDDDKRRERIAWIVESIPSEELEEWRAARKAFDEAITDVLSSEGSTINGDDKGADHV